MRQDTRCLAIAKKQHNVFSEAQALGAGMSHRTIRRRTETGEFIVLHPRVFTTPGVALTWKSHLLAACFWSVEGLASHRSAAALYGLTGFEERWRPEITVPTCHLPPRSGVIVHYTDRLPAIDRTKRWGIPTTSIERTLLDLGAVVSRDAVAIALDDALHRGLTNLDALDECLHRTARRGRRGCKGLRELIKERSGMRRFNTTALETLFFERALEFGLPRPEAQFEITNDGAFVARPDFAWPDRRLAVEMDSYEHHGKREGFERDRSRLNRLTLSRWRVIHGTWRELKERPDALMTRVWEAWRQSGDDVAS